MANRPALRIVKKVVNSDRLNKQEATKENISVTTTWPSSKAKGSRSTCMTNLFANMIVNDDAAYATAATSALVIERSMRARKEVGVFYGGCRACTWQVRDERPHAQGPRGKKRQDKTKGR